MIAKLTLTLAQPAFTGDRPRSDFVRGTSRYLPGSAVRGAFAAAWIRRYGPAAAGTARRAEFLELFEGGVRFAPLFLNGAFVPLSVRGHKYQVPDTCLRAESDLAAEPTAPAFCADCGSELEGRHGLDDAPTVQRRASVQIGSAGVALSGQLFFRDTLDAGQRFTGHLASNDSALLDRLGELGPIRIGGRRTTHGQSGVDIDTAPTELPRIPRRDDGRIILRLRGPAVFTDDQGRPIDHPNPVELHEQLGTPTEIENAWVRWEEHRGWHAASGLPKPAELAVAGGSTYVLRPTGHVPDAVLDALLERGVGLRRHEGFGDLGGAYHPRPTPRQVSLTVERAERSYAGVLALTTSPQRWSLVKGLLRKVLDEDPAGIAALRRWAAALAGASAEAPGGSTAGGETRTAEAARQLLRLLDEPDEVIHALFTRWSRL